MSFRTHAARRMQHDHDHSRRGPARHRARRGAIRGSILRLLAERPMHGYELIAELEERTGGRWRPSPGSVYPTLALLEDEGLIRATDAEGGRKRFEVTDDGRRWLAEHADEATPPWERSSLGRRADLRRMAGELVDQLRQIGRYGTPEQNERAQAVLDQARRDLYEILASPDEDAVEEDATDAPAVADPNGDPPSDQLTG